MLFSLHLHSKCMHLRAWGCIIVWGIHLFENWASFPKPFHMMIFPKIIWERSPFPLSLKNTHSSQKYLRGRRAPQIPASQSISSLQKVFSIIIVLIKIQYQILTSNKVSTSTCSFGKMCLKRKLALRLCLRLLTLEMSVKKRNNQFWDTSPFHKYS